MLKYKSGIGYDIHRLVEGRKLFLGGVEIPYIKGLLGHSDGDVLLHAVCDALLGAAACGDIGERFPDNDPKYHNIESIELLKEVDRLLKSEGFAIVNIDTVVVAQEPVLSPFKKSMRVKISETLKIQESSVNIKAKTSEGLGDIGKVEAIACYATASISKKES
ncbi:2-C-methyl-D-erythritol 2,4-cyclodiphosphate synthase [Candidatus Omnitrophota bacterium]